MDAQVREARDLVAEPNHDELLVEQRDGNRLLGEVLEPAYRMPAPPQRPMQPRLAGDVEMEIGPGHGSKATARGGCRLPPLLAAPVSPHYLAFELIALMQNWLRKGANRELRKRLRRGNRRTNPSV